MLYRHRRNRNQTAGYGLLGIFSSGEPMLVIDCPASLLATTVKLYALPGASPLIVHERAPVVVQDIPPGVASTRYASIGSPPSQSGAAQETTAEPGTPTCAVTLFVLVGGRPAVNWPDGAEIADFNGTRMRSL